MANAKYLIGASIVAAAIVATPLVISKQIDSKLEDNQRLLEKNGFKQEIISKSGYLTGKRTFTLEISDAKKARDFMLDALVAKNAQYKLFAQNLKDETNAGINEAFNGLGFKGEMLTSHLFPSDAKVSLTLAKLPQVTQEEIAKDPKASGVVLPLLDKGIFGVDMTFSSDEKLKALKLKDIKESIHVEEGTIDVDTQGHTLSLNERAGIVHGVVGIQKQNLGVKATDFTVQSNLENFLYTFDYQDDLNNKGELSLEHYAFDTKDAYSAVSFSIGAMKVTSSAEDVRKEWSLKADYALNNLSFTNALAEEVKLNTLLANLSLKGLQSESIKKIQADYNAMVLAPENGGEKALIDDFVALVRHGMVFDFNIGLKALSGTLALKDVSINTTLQIAKNDFSDQQSPLALVGLLDVTSKLKIHKEDRATLEALQLTAPQDFELGRAEGDYFVYDVTFKQGVISVNDQIIQ